jgi:hypothetical protein
MLQSYRKSDSHQCTFLRLKTLQNLSRLLTNKIIIIQGEKYLSVKVPRQQDTQQNYTYSIGVKLSTMVLSLTIQRCLLTNIIVMLSVRI